MNQPPTCLAHPVAAGRDATRRRQGRCRLRTTFRPWATFGTSFIRLGEVRRPWALCNARSATRFAVVAATAWTLPAAAQTGKIVGRVVDGQTAQPIASAQVSLSNQSAGYVSGIDGRFVLRKVPPGDHSLVVQMIGYAPKTVTGVAVRPDAVVTLDVSLEAAALELEGITVSAAIETGSTVALLAERATASFVVDAIGADQISKSPDGDAAAALARVPGLSVVDGKFAYVRGLGERYSSTTLNGAPLASPMPDRKAVPLDIVPSEMLESIVTAKSYAPDQPGDYAGGLIELRTKNFPAERIFKVKGSFSYNTVSSFQDGLRYNGGAWDFLGFDDGTRALPALVPTDQRVIFPNFSRGELEQFGEAFGGDWGPFLGSLPPNGSLGVSYGDDLELFGRSLGLLASATYDNSFSQKGDMVERVFASAGALEPEIDYDGEATTRSVSLGGLANLSYELTPTNRLTVNFLYNRLMEDEARRYQGFNLDSNSEQRNYRLRFLAQTLVNAQFGGEHLLGFLADAKMDWSAAWSRARREEPNTREVLYREEDGEFLFENFVSSGSVFHQDLVDDTYSGSADFTIPFALGSGERSGSVAFGGRISAKRRDAYTRRFRFLMVPGARIDRTREPNDLFDPTSIGSTGFELQEATFRPDNYDATEDIAAGYAKTEADVTRRIKVMMGLRVESAVQEVAPFDLFNSSLPGQENTRLDDTDLLPVLSLTLGLRDNMNLRLSGSRTLARPQLRELASFAFADYVGGYLTVGNPELARSTIRNFDARWEAFLHNGGLLAVSAFYKTFNNPIEVSVLPSSELLKTWINGGTANNYGFEFEFRTDLGFMSPSLATLALNSNVTLVRSKVITPDTIRIYVPGEGGTDLPVSAKERALQGQSPYVINLQLGYASASGRFRATALFNRFGRRIDAVGGQATPDMFEEPRSQLDIVLERMLASGMVVKLSASRLVGNIVEFTQYDSVLRRWDSGRTLSFSIGWDTGS